MKCNQSIETSALPLFDRSKNKGLQRCSCFGENMKLRGVVLDDLVIKRLKVVHHTIISNGYHKQITQELFLQERIWKTINFSPKTIVPVTAKWKFFECFLVLGTSRTSKMVFCVLFMLTENYKISIFVIFSLLWHFLTLLYIFNMYIALPITRVCVPTLLFSY